MKTYKDQFTPWKESENVLDGHETVAMLAKGGIQAFCKAWLNIEEDIKNELKCAAIRAKDKK